MTNPIHQKLVQAKQAGTLPKVRVYNRIDGPGSSLDLRLFQQSFWKLHSMPDNHQIDPSRAWSAGLPRTIGISISVGTDITATPIEPGKIGVESIDFGFSYVYNRDAIPPTRENWLLRVMDIFNLDGVKFIIQNQRPELKSAGLGGSAAVTVGVCLLANKLTGNKLNPTQIIGMAAMLEHDLGVSITGTQEQSAAVYGGVRDYAWYPWGIPGQDNFYGASLRQELLTQNDYADLRSRMDIYFTQERYSADTNAKWHEELKKASGFKMHKKKCLLAYQFREAIRNKHWHTITETINEYRNIRVQLCAGYMVEAHKKLQEMAERHNCTTFPLGAGGGSVLVYSPNPESLAKMRTEAMEEFNYVDYTIMDKGHEYENTQPFEQVQP